jgi:tyrosyl-tRNA synthetase
LGVELLTDLPLEILKKKPLVVKNLLAYDVVEQLYGKEQATPSQEYFDTTFRRKTPEYKTAIEKGKLVQALVKASGYSASEVKRLIVAGAVDINSQTIKNPSIILKGGEKIKFGKKDFYIVEK